MENLEPKAGFLKLKVFCILIIIIYLSLCSHGFLVDLGGEDEVEDEEMVDEEETEEQLYDSVVERATTRRQRRVDYDGDAQVLVS